MRAVQWVGLACLGAASWAAAAGSAPPVGDGGNAPHAILPQPGVGLAPGFEGAAYKPPGRLRYLDARRCEEHHACGGVVSALAKSQPHYARALSLVTYGRMDVKFTGDRVKVRVNF